MAKQQAPKKKANKSFTHRMYIPGFGYVDIGDEVTEEIEAAWKSWTTTPLSNYVK